MEEIDAIHDTTAEWSAITKLLDKIGAEEERIGWPALINMCSDVLNMADNATGEDVFFGPYQFFFRLYYRIKSMDRPEPFNKVYADTILINHTIVPAYRIVNYDYKTFSWCRRKKLIERLDNMMVVIPKDKLTQAEANTFEKKVITD